MTLPYANSSSQKGKIIADLLYDVNDDLLKSHEEALEIEINFLAPVFRLQPTWSFKNSSAKLMFVSLEL